MKAFFDKGFPKPVSSTINFFTMKKGKGIIAPV